LRVGLFTDAFPELTLEETLGWLAAELPSVRDVEIGSGGYSPAPHCDLEPLLTSADARDEWLGSFGDLRVCALNVSGNPLESSVHDGALRKTIALAARIGVDRVVCMSGGRAELSGGAWFPGVEEAVEDYWTARVLPYWSEVSELAAAEHPTLRLCFELEPGAAVFNVSTLERLLELGPNLAANLDPSHFFWQSIDPLAAIRRLAGRIGFAHGKDTVLDDERVEIDGVLDRQTWRYATVGHGRGVDWWSSFVQELGRAGYDEVVSIEYEDPRLPPAASVAEAAGLLAEAVTGVAAR
jgi:sugar phosphate isomerase/epimerase